MGLAFSKMHGAGNDFVLEQASAVGGLALAFLLLRAFASGCTALTGVEAISNGVPAFRKPKSRNAATTLALLGGIAVTMLLGIMLLAVSFAVVFLANRLPLLGGSRLEAVRG